MKEKINYLKEKINYLNETLAVSLDETQKPFLLPKDSSDTKTASDLILGGVVIVLNEKFGTSTTHYEIASIWFKTKKKLIK